MKENENQLSLAQYLRWLDKLVRMTLHLNR